jgi:hypothetical protein
MNLARITYTPRRRWLGGMVGAVTLILAMAAPAWAGLVAGALPAAGFTYTSTTSNAVNMSGDGIRLRTKGPVAVKTTYSKAAPSTALLGWHFHHGPVIVTVTVGTLTLIDESCSSFDLAPGQSYIESSGEVLNGFVDPAKNAGVSAVEWFSTRLYPVGAADPEPVPAPCEP